MPQGDNIKTLTGQRFSRLSVLWRAENKPYTHNAVWTCRCDCGAVVDVVGCKLVSGQTKSCGCFRRARLGQAATKHGKSGTREFWIWNAAKVRCYNRNEPSFLRYGARGITMCDRWRASFSAFLEDMGEAPSRRHSLDRLDNDRGYEPGNVRWADPFQQANNKRNNRRLTFDGLTLTVTEWERKLGMPAGRLKARLRAGWDERRAMTEPIKPLPSDAIIDHAGQRRSIKDLAHSASIPARILLTRLRAGWPVVEALSLPISKRNPKHFR